MTQPTQKALLIIAQQVHPYTEGYLSEFWNGSCGSTATHWMPLPTPPQPEK